MSWPFLSLCFADPMEMSSFALPHPSAVTRNNGAMAVDGNHEPKQTFTPITLFSQLSVTVAVGGGEGEKEKQNPNIVTPQCLLHVPNPPQTQLAAGLEVTPSEAEAMALGFPY